MNPLLLVTIISTGILISISLFLNRKKSPFQYVFPLVISILGIAVIILGLVVGRWQGLGLSTVGFSLLLSSIIAVIVVSIVSLRKEH
ncbi:YesK family protein [Gottfriedia sp. NPDC058432]|uniref:YesK family protein n=1 Tax=Gottfriedia sp. NPDC058432 TaxID=3346497 RepID=UPI0036645267